MKYILIFSHIIIVILASTAENVGVGYAFSTYLLKRLIVHEQKIVPVLREYLAVLQTQVNILKMYEAEVKATINSSPDTMTQVNGEYTSTQKLDWPPINPIGTFHVVNRISRSLPQVLKGIDDTVEYGLAARLHSLRSEIKYPNARDYVDSKMGIVRLQQTFKVPVTELAQGNLLGFATKSGLSLENLYELGTYAHRNSLYTLALEYLDACLKQVKALEERDEEFENFVTDGMSKIAEMHDAALGSGKFIQQRNPYHFSKALGALDSASYRNKTPVNPNNFWKAHPSLEGRLGGVFGRICKKGDLRNATVKKDLYCEFSSTIYPYLYIQRYKYEWLNLKPPVLRIHDFVTEDEITNIRHAAEPFLERSGVEIGNGTQKTHSGRTSSNTFLMDTLPTSKFHYISKRISMLTGLNVDESSSEEMQIANYGPGGFYAPHFDALADGNGTQQALSKEREDEFLHGIGDRISTFMIYLSNVQKGGGTAFVQLKFSALPIKGSAVFWNNLHLDGTLDTDSLHGGCPILYGSKFIANKWIRSDGQMFTAKCPFSQAAIVKSNFTYN